MKTCSFFLVIIFSLLSSLLYADIINVPADTLTIQGGIYLASEGDTVLVAEDTYFENINFRGKSITVASQFIMDGDTSHISKTIIDGSKPSDPDSGSVVYFISGEDSTSVLAGFTITHGSGTMCHLYDAASSTSEIWKSGGGICIDSSGGNIRYNYIINNSISDYKNCAGAGIDGLFVLKDRALIIENNKVEYNTVHAPSLSGGGGISLFEVQGFCLIRKNSVSYNSVTVDADFKAVAGGIDCEFNLPTTGQVIITENIVSYNEIHCKYGYGAGMYFVYWETTEPIHDKNPTPLVYNNIISNNYSQDAGAGVAIWYAHKKEPEYFDMSPQPAFINNTIVGNKAARGSAIYCWNASFLLMNCILWNDLSAQYGSEIDVGKGGSWYWDKFPNDHNKISIYNSIISDGYGSDFNNMVIATSPLITDPLYNLSENSPAVGMGRKSIFVDGSVYQAPFYDFNGNIRPNPIDTLIDIGAFESSFPANKFVYPKSIETVDAKTYYRPSSDVINFTSNIYNPDNNNINVFARIVSVDNAQKDSVELFDDGEHNDGESGDLVFGGKIDPINVENEFRLSLGIKDNDQGNYRTYLDNKRITTIGTIIVVSDSLTPQFGTVYSLNISLKNEGQLTTAKNITVELTTTDTSSVFSITPFNREPIDIPANEIIEIEQSHNINFTSTASKSIPFTVKIYSNGYHFWTDYHIVTSIENELQKVPKIFSLGQNAPNPFNPVTSINYQIPKASEVKLSIYNVLGQRVVTLVNERQNVGAYKVDWDATNFASGIYYYRLDADEYVDVKKMILIK